MYWVNIVYFPSPSAVLPFFNHLVALAARKLLLRAANNKLILLSFMFKMLYRLIFSQFADCCDLIINHVESPDRCHFVSSFNYRKSIHKANITWYRPTLYRSVCVATN